MTFFFFLGRNGKKKKNKGGGERTVWHKVIEGKGWIFTFTVVYSESDFMLVLVMNKLRYCPLGLYWLNSVVVMDGVF